MPLAWAIGLLLAVPGASTASSVVHSDAHFRATVGERSAKLRGGGKDTNLVVYRVDASSSTDGNYAVRVLDNDPGTRWEACGQDQYIRFDLGRTQTISSISVAFYLGGRQSYAFDVEVTSDVDQRRWTFVGSYRSTQREGPQTFALLRPASARYLRILAKGSTTAPGSCNSYSEVRLSGRPYFTADVETGDTAQFSELECSDKLRQFQITSHPVRQGRFAARFAERAGDLWPGNNTVRCLAIIGQTNEAAGDDYYYSMSFYFPAPITTNLLWETHARPEIYTLGDPLSVAPNALIATSTPAAYDQVATRLSLRLNTGAAVWRDGAWQGWTYSEPDVPLIAPIPIGVWIDIIVHIRFSETNGMVEVWTRTGRRDWPRQPVVQRVGIPTLQYVPGGLDAKVPADIHTSTLYDAIGLYKGGNAAVQEDVVYVDGYAANGSLKEAQAMLR